MRNLRNLRPLLFVALALLGRARAEEAAAVYNLTLDGALDLARTRAPRLLAARAAVEVSRGRRAGLSPWIKDNPVLEADAGPRWSGGARSLDLDVSLGQTFELGGKGRKRIALADAKVDEAAALAADATRRTLGVVASTFVRCLHADAQLRLAQENERLAAELGHVAGQRYASGDVGALDANVAAIVLVRARADAHAAEAERTAALGALRVLLDIEPTAALAVSGDLRDRKRYDLDELLIRTTDRADLRALLAEVNQADAEVRLGEGFAWPDVGVRLGYSRDEGDDIARGGVSLTLPFFNRGQARQATGAAERQRAHALLAARRRAAHTEVQTAYEAYRSLLEAVQALERDALPRLAENETLARRSYEAGRLSLSELLLVRREAVATRTAYTDLLRDAALAAVELEVQAGVLQ